MKKGFYEHNGSPTFRFGDIIKGLLTFEPVFKNLPLNDSAEFNINLKYDWHVILSPCCQIEKERILLAPLETAKKELSKIPRVASDYTLINEPMRPINAVIPEAFKNMSPEIQAEVQSRNEEFVYSELFIFAPHENFGLQIKPPPFPHDYYRMIDFKRTFSLKSPTIIRPSNVPITLKVLELTVPIRHQLRNKLANFYSRIPNEDKPSLGL